MLAISDYSVDHLIDRGFLILETRKKTILLNGGKLWGKILKDKEEKTELHGIASLIVVESDNELNT